MTPDHFWEWESGVGVCIGCGAPHTTETADELCPRIYSKAAHAEAVLTNEAASAARAAQVEDAGSREESPNDPNHRGEGHEGFKLDTSGHVVLQYWSIGIPRKTVRWIDLSPFAQGYVEGLFAERFPGGLELLSDALGFSDLSPAALSVILADCDAVAPDGGLNGYLPTNESAVADARGAGAEFWRRRNKLVFKRFPPLRASLTIEGRIDLKEAGQ